MGNLFAWASISEYGTTDGKPGNQSGAELRVGNYYNFGQTHCIRIKNLATRRKCAKIAKALAKNMLIGYSQKSRESLFKQAENCNWNYERLVRKLKPCNTDCSSFCAVCVNLAFGEEIFTVHTYTGNMIDQAKRNKKLSVVPIKKAEKKFHKADMPIKEYKHVIINV